MVINFTTTIEIFGTAAFTISGIYSAIEKRLDLLGVFIIGFVTAIGGGTIRDLLIGQTPVSWMVNSTAPVTTLITSIITLFLRQKVKNYKATLFFFDALGLGLFTVTGMQKGLQLGLEPGICILLGTITGCFGGVCRDILLTKIPVLFRKEIYATACIIGGVGYLIFVRFMSASIAELITVIIISSIRIVGYKKKLQLPAL